MNYLEVVRTILSLIPVIIDTIKAIESALPVGGAGAQKLEAIKGILQSAYTVGGGAVEQFNSLWPALQSTIGVLVGFFNATGVFKTKT